MLTYQDISVSPVAVPRAAVSQPQASQPQASQPIAAHADSHTRTPEELPDDSLYAQFDMEEALEAE